MSIAKKVADVLLDAVVPKIEADAAVCNVGSCCDSNKKWYCCNYDPDVRCYCIINTTACDG
ncbi:hypothetical protein [Pseudonocardia sp. TRM90224]|uniref:hypothetical protein n=1 Tax=Pseudonocardia sp. TRM90224 TaxID=2812678 RepID=UPI001E2F3780|nr:hypothetical protein [Pseudonocardia sp. TRM90224]